MRAAALLVALAACSTIADTPKPPGPGALVLVIDRSGSMQGPKLEAALDASSAAASSLAPDDIVAVVGFDSEAAIYVTPQVASDRKRFAEELAHLTAGGGTNILPGLEEAHEILRAVKVPTKHVILLSGGEAPYDGIAERVREMRDDHITISTVAVAGADETLLQQISTQGGGRMYKVDDLKRLTQTFVKETQLALLK